MAEDRFAILWGASLFNLYPATGIESPTDDAPCMIKLVPTGDGIAEPGMPPEVPDRQLRQVEVRHQMMIGTVDELVGRFREQIEQAAALQRCEQNESLTADNAAVMAAAGVDGLRYVPPRRRGVVTRPMGA